MHMELEIRSTVCRYHAHPQLIHVLFAECDDCITDAKDTDIHSHYRGGQKVFLFPCTGWDIWCFILSFTLECLPFLVPLTPTHICISFHKAVSSCDLKPNHVSALSERHPRYADTRSPLRCLSLINMICSPTCFHHFYYSNTLLSIPQQTAQLLFVVLSPSVR